ncbi:uncharacterized protein ACA1_352380 [Acanthamoeba castellanii str. Neff]|uniref:Secreted protein n=1 Tax=Acanthamoeba castellanii (strain ATCC 30010 / Neff) TaxID=1257118 RepID=L8GWC5_ACACF|nr:uncharacterized protein ACA1_352380 [Acanthamoeba castellanii str. Neff]ELR16396.1 hypothetical protein ACA1_352380 [Acanthamoeba castellanii str. Neff]
MPSSLLLVTALTFFLASSFVLTRGDHTSQHSLHDPRVLHCLSRSAVRSLQFCLCLNDLDLEFFYTLWKKRGSTVLRLPRQTRAFQTMKDEEDPDGPPARRYDN